MNNEHSHGSEARKLSRIEHLAKRRRKERAPRNSAVPKTPCNTLDRREFQTGPFYQSAAFPGPVRFAASVTKPISSLLATINQEGRLPLSTNKSSFPFRRTPQAKTLFARPLVMPLIHERGFPLLNPKLTRHLERAPRPNRIEHANTLAYRSCKRPSSFHDEQCRIADDATKPQITRASAAALQPNQAIPA